MLDNYPLQIYESGLVFSPSNSLVKKMYARMAPAWATLTIHPEDNWPAQMTSFHKDPGWSQAVTYSTDGNCIAIGHHNGDLLVYDVITGSLCQRGKIDDCKIVKGMAYGDTNSNILILYDVDVTETKLSLWDLQSLQIRDIKSFPLGNKLSPDAKYVSCCKGTGISLYDIDSDETFLLLSHVVSFHSDSDAAFPTQTFSTDGHSLAVQWVDGLIEVWNISERSLIRTFQADSDRNMALSKDSKILAIFKRNISTDSAGYSESGSSICSYSSSGYSKFKVLSVETGALLWQTEGECPYSISFLKHELIIYSEYRSHTFLSDAWTGVCLGVVPEGNRSRMRPISFEQQLAAVSENTIHLFDRGQLQVPSTRFFHIIQLLDNQLHILATDAAESFEWFECWDSDTGEILWSAPTTKAGESEMGRHCVSSNSYIAMVQDDIVLVSHRIGLIFEKHSAFPVGDEVELYFSPDGARVVCCGHDFTIVYDIEARRTDKTTFTWARLYNNVKLFWSNDCQRMLMHVRGQNRGLHWSHSRGFDELQIDTSISNSLSPSGTMFASLAERTEYIPPLETAEGLYSHGHQW